MNNIMKFISKAGIIILGIIIIFVMMKSLLIGSLLGIIFIILILMVVSHKKALKEAEKEKINLEEYNRKKQEAPNDTHIITISEFYYKDITCNNVDTLWWISNDNLNIIASDFKNNFGILDINKKDIWYFTTMDKVYLDNSSYEKDFSNCNSNAVNDIAAITIKDIKQLRTKGDERNEVVIAIKDDDDFSYMYLDKKYYKDLVEILPSKELKD